MSLAATATLAALVSSLSLLASCGSAADPYDALTTSAAQYVIPESSGWTSGELCPDGGSCSGSITVDVIVDYDWFRITDLGVEGDDASTRSVEVELTIAEARVSDSTPDAPPELRMWGPDLDGVEEVISLGFDVWAGADPEIAYVAVFVAFDSDGRFAGIGNAAADFFTVPVAQLAADANAPSGVAYLGPLMDE